MSIKTVKITITNLLNLAKNCRQTTDGRFFYSFSLVKMFFDKVYYCPTKDLSHLSYSKRCQYFLVFKIVFVVVLLILMSDFKHNRF